MRIGFDTSPLERPYPEGVKRACRGLLRGLQEFTELDVVPMAPRDGESERAWRHLHLPREIERSGLDGFHSAVSAFPWRGPGRRVSTVHELPWRNGVRENAGAGHRFWAQYGVGRADGVLCPTEFVRQQLIEECGGAGHVVRCPWGREELRGASAEEEDRVLAGLGLADVSYALAVGATRPKKNLRGMLRALGRWRTAGETMALHLVVTGQRTDALAADLKLADELGLEGLVHAVGHVTERELSVLQARARLALVLAHSEGFAFPALEALQYGTPLVVTAGSAQAEVAGKCGVLADSRDTRSMVDAMRIALSSSSTEAAERRQRAEPFSWKHSAQVVEELWLRWV